MAATVKDIAKRLQISTSTVCYALNGGPRPVNEETRHKVLQLAKELDYRPNRLARSLATRRTSTIGVVPPSTEINVFRSMFVQLAWNAIVNESENLGYDLLLFAGKNLNGPEVAGLGLLDGRIDGVVFIAPQPDSNALHLMRQRNFPHTCIASAIEDPGVNFCVDNASGIRLAVEHLVKLGHKNIAHIGGYLASPDGRSRHDAFKASMIECGLKCTDRNVLIGHFTRSYGWEATIELLGRKDRPTAIVCANDEIAFGACEAAEHKGFNVPSDLSITGFDDTDIATQRSPKLTTVRQPIDLISSAALRAVVSLSWGELDTQSQVFPTSLVVRESTAIPPNSVPA